MADLLKPKDFSVLDHEGKEHFYILSKIPAVEGREILCQYPLTALPKVGDYKANEEVMLKLMSFVGVKAGNTVVRLTSPTLINNHVPDAVVNMAIEREMFQYNFGFFLEERALTFFERLIQMVDSKISSMLIPSSQR